MEGFTQILHAELPMEQILRQQAELVRYPDIPSSLECKPTLSCSVGYAFPAATNLTYVQISSASQVSGALNPRNI